MSSKSSQIGTTLLMMLFGVGFLEATKSIITLLSFKYYWIKYLILMVLMLIPIIIFLATDMEDSLFN